jgi:hypothetical protein
MDRPNPYAAPQTIPIADQDLRPELDFETDILPLANGAYYCYDALKTLLSLFAGIFLIPFPSLLAFAADYLMPCFIVIAHLLHLYGLTKLLQAQRESGVRWLFTAALFFFGLAALSAAGSFLLYRNSDDTELACLLVESCVLLFMGSFATLLWGMAWIGDSYQLPQTSRWARLSLICGGYIVLLALGSLLSAATMWLRQTMNNDLRGLLELLLLISGWLAVLLAVIFYTLVLKSLMRLKEFIPPHPEALIANEPSHTLELELG